MTYKFLFCHFKIGRYFPWTLVNAEASVKHAYRAIDLLIPKKKTIHVISCSPTIIDSDKQMLFTFSFHIFNYLNILLRTRII
jgi:hypothetical protein